MDCIGFLILICNCITLHWSCKYCWREVSLLLLVPSSLLRCIGMVDMLHTILFFFILMYLEHLRLGGSDLLGASLNGLLVKKD